MMPPSGGVKEAMAVILAKDVVNRNVLYQQRYQNHIKDFAFRLKAIPGNNLTLHADFRAAVQMAISCIGYP